MIERIEDRARGVALEVIVAGAGPDVVLVPSSLRGAADFADLQARLAGAGFRTLAINPRGTAGSTAAQSGLTLAEVIDDIAFVIDRRVEYVEVADCGHAILPEQPVGIAGLIADYLRRQG